MILPPLGIEETQCGKFTFLPVGRIFREIKIGVQIIAKFTILVILESHKLDFDEILQFYMAEMDKNQHLRTSKTVEITIFEAQKSLKLTFPKT